MRLGWWCRVAEAVGRGPTRQSQKAGDKDVEQGTGVMNIGTVRG